MSYLEDIKVSLEEPAALAVLMQVKAPAIGELSRDDFVDGWEELAADSIEKQKTHAARFRASLKSNPEFFRSVYRYSHILARPSGQKSVPLETAIGVWSMLYSAEKGMNWSSKGFSWIEHYIDFVQEKWKKSVGKDLWDQTLYFALKTIEDPSLAWWNEVDSAWPSILDEFAGHVKSLPEYKTVFKGAGAGAGDGMDTGE